MILRAAKENVHCYDRMSKSAACLHVAYIIYFPYTLTRNNNIINSIAVSLTIEPPASVGVGQPETPTTPTPSKRMRAIMSVKGYILPDPEIPNRLTVWFTGGKLSPARLPSNGDETDDEDHVDKTESDGYGGFEEWKAIFAKGKWRKTLGERARAMAAKLLLGADVPSKMEDDGHMEYTLHRPVGGHSKVSKR